MSRFGSIGRHLYEGRISIDFVGRRKLWYSISAAILVFAVVGLLVRGLTLGIEFKGGVEFDARIAATDANVTKVIQAVDDANVPQAGDPTAVTSGSDSIRIQTKAISQDQASRIEASLKSAGVSEVSQNLIGPTWGQQVATKALTGLIVFLVLVTIFIAAWFRQPAMAAAAIVALVHDLLITVGVYAWSGFEVTPATVTGLLTILGYSLYDTVVVFDKVRENTLGFERQTVSTFAEQSNLAVNQTLVRSINTAITALIPVVALLIVGVGVLGSGPLKDLALALLVGMVAGVYSSVCIATPLFVQIKGRDRAVKAQATRVEAARGRGAQEPSTTVA
ncbi:protein translocase subunit SecF [Solicola sp. PLA-1-18]|uniref:protein translocase subunit SecF n=1 Tax=Solicola sp. PLA-1-18 TaxID=3380532 RepID=UPI003B7B5CBE